MGRSGENAPPPDGWALPPRTTLLEAGPQPLAEHQISPLGTE